MCFILLCFGYFVILLASEEAWGALGRPVFSLVPLPWGFCGFAAYVVLAVLAQRFGLSDKEFGLSKGNQCGQNEGALSS